VRRTEGNKGFGVLITEERANCNDTQPARREEDRRKVQVLPPEVRLIEGVQVKQPIMHVRISMELRFLDTVKRALLERGAVPEEEHVRSRYCVLRYLAPLAHLLGLPAELSLLTEDQARHWIILSHCALVNGDPGGRAA
jgi:hypothetical protein